MSDNDNIFNTGLVIDGHEIFVTTRPYDKKYNFYRLYDEEGNSVADIHVPHRRNDIHYIVAGTVLGNKIRNYIDSNWSIFIKDRVRMFLSKYVWSKGCK